MFIVIQEIQLKKPNKNGAYKEYKVDTVSFSIGDVSKTYCTYIPNYDAGRFDRPHREAYKISVHQSYRENGKVKSKQCVIATIGYYSLAEDFWGLYDLTESGLDRAAKMFGESDGLYDLVEAKITPLRERIQKEYHKTEESKTVRERDKVNKRYQKAKTAFAKKYSVDADQYDYCYDVFGHVMNPDYLEEIIRNANAYSSYSDNSYGNYSGDSSSQQDYSSYFKAKSSNYNDEEKLTLKKFYKKLTMEFHPDRNPDTDTTKEMQLINKLKEEWNL